MISSLRRITLTIFFITLIAFGIGIFSTDFSLCNDVVKCVANVSLYNVDITTAQSTPQSLPNKNFDWKLFNEAMRVVSLYAVFASIIILIALEFFEIHFLKALLRRWAR